MRCLKQSSRDATRQLFIGCTSPLARLYKSYFIPLLLLAVFFVSTTRSFSSFTSSVYSSHKSHSFQLLLSFQCQYRQHAFLHHPRLQRPGRPVSESTKHNSSTRLLIRGSHSRSIIPSFLLGCLFVPLPPVIQTQNTANTPQKATPKTPPAAKPASSSPKATSTRKTAPSNASRPACKETAPPLKTKRMKNAKRAVWLVLLLRLLLLLRKKRGLAQRLVQRLGMVGRLRRRGVGVGV